MNNENKELEVSSPETSVMPENSTVNSTPSVTPTVSPNTPVENAPTLQEPATSSVSEVPAVSTPQPVEPQNTSVASTQATSETSTSAVSEVPAVSTPQPAVSQNTPVVNAQAIPQTPVTNTAVMPSGVPGAENKKGGSKIVIIIVILLLLVMIAVGVYFFCFRDKDKGKDTIPNSASNVDTNTNNGSNSNTNQNASGNVMSLEELSQSFNSLSTIKKYNEIDGYFIASSVEGNKFVVTIKLSESLANGGPTETRIDGILEENILTFKASGSTDEIMSTAMMSVWTLTAKATKDGIAENDAVTVLSGDPVGKLEENGYEVTVTQTSIECKIDLSKKIVLPDLGDKYITEDDLDFIDDILEYKSGSMSGHVGMMYYYFKMSSIANETTILVAEKSQFTDKSYQSILSFIKKLYGETELNNFKTQYTKVENKTFGKYEITLNPQLDDYESYYNDGYVVVQIIVKD